MVDFGLDSSGLGQNQRLAHIKTVMNVRVVLCGCETWSLTLREEHGLRVFENRVLRRIFLSLGGTR